MPSRRTVLGALGVGWIAALTSRPAGATPEDGEAEGSNNGEGADKGNSGGAVSNWQQDVDANGHALSALGSLAMAENGTLIADFAGENLSIDDDGILNASAPNGSPWADVDPEDGLLEALGFDGIDVPNVANTDGELVLVAGGEPALRLEPAESDPNSAGNVVAGHPSNAVGADILGAVVAGGGYSDGGEFDWPNKVLHHFGTVGGGARNTAGDTPSANAAYATVGGGLNNTAGKNSATVGGGLDNVADHDLATIGGGRGNSALGLASTVAGGWDNTAENADAATVGGGRENAATTANATVGGGRSNTAGNTAATVGGGTENDASNANATVGGGAFNTASGEEATVGGGRDNTASGVNATVGGGSGNTASTTNAISDFDEGYPTVGGGRNNTADGADVTVGGGNSNTASVASSTVGGGSGNTASHNSATVGGGQENTASTFASTVGGGNENQANGDYATVGGGFGNTASSDTATVPGGLNNTASGDYSFAAGRKAAASHDGAVVFGDSNVNEIQSQNPDEFRSQMPMYAPSFNTTSARAAKTAVEPVDPEAVLDRVQALDVSTWEFRDEDDGRHMGPMAGEFHDAFGLGGDTDSIATVDADGVALAAIQGLAEELDAKDKHIDTLERRIEALETAVKTVTARR